MRDVKTTVKDPQSPPPSPDRSSGHSSTIATIQLESPPDRLTATDDYPSHSEANHGHAEYE